MITTILPLCFIATSYIFAQEPNCPKLNTTAAQKNSGASRYNECCEKDAKLADIQIQSIKNKDSIIKIHAPFGLPTTETKGIVTLVNPTYIIGYDTINKVPNWVMYKLATKKEIDTKVSRMDCFRYDPRISIQAQAAYNAFDVPGDDTLQRGHMKPSADGYRDNNDNLNTFIMTNMAPQHKTFNMCEWEVLEGFIREHSLADSVDQAYVVSGSIISSSSKKLNGNITIPDAFYKVYYFKSNGKWHYWTFYVEHDWSLMKYDEYLDNLKNHRYPVDWIEEKGKVNLHFSEGDNGIPESVLDNTFSLKGIGKYSGWCAEFK